MLTMPPSATATNTPRLTSLDALRGIVMIIMALDHVRDFFHADAMAFRPEDLARTNAALFFTRWITHFCAPVFFFLAGAGAFLWAAREGRTTAALSRFLWTRGLWLIVLELTVLRFGFFFSLTEGPWLLTVLWALGLSMIGLALLCRMPVRVLAPVSLAVIALHNLLDPLTARQFGPLAFAWHILHQPGAFVAGGTPVIVAYPLVPWVAVMAAGYCFASCYLRVVPSDSRRLPVADPAPVALPSAARRMPAGPVLPSALSLVPFVSWGAFLTAAFVVLRALDIYGDPSPWSTTVPGTGALSFLNTTKYPPSLLFLLMTMGPALLALAWLSRRPPRASSPVAVIGRVPLFFFLVHFLLAHALAIPFALVKYGHADFLAHPMPSMGGSAELYPPGFGYSLPTVYVVWAIVVLLSYPLCLWFARLKARRRDWWRGYL
jgi:uncharacterized membrane protein